MKVNSVGKAFYSSSHWERLLKSGGVQLLVLVRCGVCMGRAADAPKVRCSGCSDSDVAGYHVMSLDLAKLKSFREVLSQAAEP